ncbi:threonine--tRNA ligase [Sutterella wadsworthensis]|uniref:threonine--tRNA ligase n=1 Tax=Sutterella wadsworthensis TaxID=40545 RepID=UPI0001F60644|nr:threonine--tRNA ligase [Sutterella wadsworthensis]EFW01102.1 threonyl-tRNA synthetase [Sutterella wadsworthensis 3_1_45B]
MASVTLPGGSKREYEGPVTVAQVAASIGAGLAKAALAGRVDGKLVDLSHVIDGDAAVAIITARDPEGLEIIRHSTAHLMAQAVKELFPEAQVTIGPAIENGFYYDFSYTRAFTPEDLKAIEARMDELVKKNIPIVREEMPREEAIDFFKALGEHYKAEIISSIPAGEVISLYRQGDFVDLCRGPHVPSTGCLKVHHLMKVAGAYWRGDSKNEMLQRIYGTAWATKDEQKAYLEMLAEAEKRDHRRLGRELDLFHLQDEAPGMVFWHAKGWALWQVIEQFMRRVYQDNGYEEVKAPQLLDRSLWERSGHWAKYRDNMFTTESENRYYALKPMNCPGHIQIFNSKLRSYRDLPLRIGEFGQCHRNESSGSLHGLMRVRGFTQDDGHIFCTEDQILAECEAFTALVQKVYKTFGFTDIAYKVATRPAMRIGEDAVWDKAEHALMASLDALGIKYEVLVGEGAFYGPKIEYHLKDCLGRSWQCGTVQVDFQMPGRLGAEYVAEDNSRKIPVMLHRAILGSLERWIGMLIEEFAGAFPVWLAPIQCAVTSITDNQGAYAKDVAAKLHAAGLRVQTDLRSEKINYKIRELSLQKLPYILVVGEKEAQTGTVSVRARGGENLGVMSLDAFIERISTENRERTR